MAISLGLRPTSVPLQDGFASWDASAADALEIWNGYLDTIHISSVSVPIVPKRLGDGVNAVYFSTNILGDSFGDSTLAVAVVHGTQPNVTSEADVLVNSAYRFNSYRGPLQSSTPHPVYDIHRVFLHEFGHVLGLDHVPSDFGPAIMEPVISNWDHLGNEDTAGARGLYGADFPQVETSQFIRVGDYVDEWFAANNDPLSYSATGVPPGLTFDIGGFLTGTATKGGVYNMVVTARGALATAYKSVQLTVLGFDEVPGLLNVLSFPFPSSLLADPVRPRVYTAGSSSGIDMIDTNTFARTRLISDSIGNTRLSISADASTLLFTRPYAAEVQARRINLQSLQELAPLPLPANLSEVLEGLEHRAYVAGTTGVCQINATTGALQKFFAPPLSTSTVPPTIAISSDRKTLFVARASPDGDLSTYDISTPNPVLLHQLPGSFASLTPSPNDQYLYYTKSNTTSRSLIQARLPALSPARVVSTSPHLDFTAIAPNGSIYSSLSPVDEESRRSASFSIYDPTTLYRTGPVEIDNFLPEPYRPYYHYRFGDIKVDRSGKYLFATVSGFSGTAVWIFSTDLASHPAIVHASKNLLNISTRARVETGENATIAGFIVQGTKSKKVLIRGLGPSLPITGALSNPILDLYDSTGRHLASNDDWISTRLAILSSSIPPTSPREAALLMTLQPGAYTAIVRDKDNQPGLTLIETYDLSPKDSLLANISTRGKIQTGDNVMIGGFIVGGADPTKVLVRAIGPSLANHGVHAPLVDPTLELHDGTGRLIASNDNWRSNQAQIISTGIPPTDNRESAILMTLNPGNYTAIVRGKNGATGVALVEVYNLR